MPGCDIHSRPKLAKKARRKSLLKMKYIIIIIIIIEILKNDPKI